MTNPSDPETWIRDFGSRYDYDVSYLLELADASPRGLEQFQAVEPLATFRGELPLDAHFIARIASMRSQDCGPCTQLTLRMAIEEGVDRELLETLLRAPEELPEELRDVHDHASAVAGGGPTDAEVFARLEARYGKTGTAEIGLLIAGSVLYPTMKRALLHDRACVVGALEY